MPMPTFSALAKSSVRRLVVSALLFLVAPVVFALTPVARFDVVPFQRIDQAEVFNVGVVAFSKAGISNVTFTIAGQGYAGPNPQVATSMTYNPRTDVHEYWVPIRASDFATDGAFTVSAIVTGGDGDSRTLDPVPLVVNSTGGLAQPEVWVSPTGSDSTGRVGDSFRPFRTVASAIPAIESINGGRSDGAIVYLEEGEYDLGNAAVSTSDEWLTFAAAPDASRENVIVHGAGSVAHTKLIRFYGLTLRSDANHDLWLEGWPDPEPTWLWVDASLVVGSGRWESYTSPIYRNDNTFVTDTHISNTGIAVRFADIVRNVDAEDIGDDFLFLCDMVINATLNNQDPNVDENDSTPTYNHADGWQWANAGMENLIVYGYHATDVHYQGIFARMAPGGGVHRNSAFVNVLIEPRYPRRPGHAGSTLSEFETVSFYGPMDHILVWHSTINVGRAFNTYSDPAGFPFSMSNSSFVGNVFNSYHDWTSGDTDPLAYGAPGNAEGNEFIHNHYTTSRVDSGSGHVYSKSPDTQTEGSQSTGDPGIVTTLDAVDYGTPTSTSPLLNRLSATRVPIDVYGNLRDSQPDVGAIEYQGASGGSSPPAAPTGLRVR